MYAIPKTSWHWQLVSSRYSYKSSHVSLCKYFWTAVWCSFARVMEFLFSGRLRLISIALLVFCVYVVPMYIFWQFILTGLDEYLPDVVMVLFMFGLMGTIVTAMAAMFGIGATIKYFGEKTNFGRLFEALANDISNIKVVKKIYKGWKTGWKAVVSGKRKLVDALFSERLVVITTAFLLFIGIALLYAVYACYGISYYLPWWLIILTMIGGVEIVVLSLMLTAGAIALLLKYDVIPGVANKVTSTETYKLIAAFIKAKKEKVCPLLRIPGSV